MKNFMIIVIGASSGIGKTISNYLIKKGEKIITVSRSKTEFDNHFECDVTDYKSLKKIYKFLNQNYKNIEAIINCAGYSIYESRDYNTYILQRELLKQTL